MKTKALLSAAAAALLFLSACSVGSTHPSPTVQISAAIQDADIGAEIGEQGFNAEVKDGVVILDTAGSSSCPPTIASGTFIDGVLTLEREAYKEGTACTMDYRTFRQEISPSDGEEFDADITVTVSE